VPSTKGIPPRDISGDLSAESTTAHHPDRIDSGNVDLYTVTTATSRTTGPIKDKGLYRLTTHNGHDCVGDSGARRRGADVRTYNGKLPLHLPG
jgi:hypothetical protein